MQQAVWRRSFRFVPAATAESLRGAHSEAPPKHATLRHCGLHQGDRDQPAARRSLQQPQQRFQATGDLDRAVADHRNAIEINPH